jgi:hypothetical protein
LGASPAKLRFVPFVVPDFRSAGDQIDIQNRTAYNLPMGTLGTPAPATQERDSSRLIIVITMLVVIGLALGAAFLFREPPRKVVPPSPYLAQLKLSDFKMSAAQNFIGSTVSYIDGTVTNTSSQTVTRVVVEVTFKDSMGQVAGVDSVPLRVVRTNGAYLEPVDLATAPLSPGQSVPFRLTFDAISAQWNHQYPDIVVTDVGVK